MPPNLRRSVRTLVDGVALPMLAAIRGSLGRRLRYAYYKPRLKHCGVNVQIDEGVVIQNPQYVSLGDNVWLDRYCILIAGPANLEDRCVKRRSLSDASVPEGELRIGSNVHVAPFSLIQSHGGFSMGSHGGIAAGARIYTLSNHPNDPFDRSRVVQWTNLSPNSAYIIGPIVFGENVGVSINSIVLGGTHLRDATYVTPNSIVLGEFPANSVLGGSPAVRLRERFSGAML